MKNSAYHELASWFYDIALTFLAITALFTALNVHGYDFSFIRQLLVLFLLLAIIMIRLFAGHRSTLRFPTHAVVRWWLLFCAWCAMSLMWTEVKGFTFLVVLTMFSAPISLLLAFWANDRQWQMFKQLLLLLALLSAALTSYQAFVLGVARPAGFFLNWNTNSAFIGAILLPWVAAYMWHITQKSAVASGLGLFLLLCAFGMSLGQGRASLFTLMVGLMVLCVAHRKQARAGIAIASATAWVIGGFVLGDVLHGGMLGQRLTEISDQAAGGMESLGSGRKYLWEAGWQMYLDRPWLGWGLGLYHMLYPQYRSSLHVEDGNFAHNDYLEFLLELGPIGLLLCLAWVVALLKQSWRLYQTTEDVEQRFADLGLSLACAGLLLHACVDFHLYQAPMLMLLGAYAGRLCWRVSERAPETSACWRPQAQGTAGGYFSILAGISLFISIACFNISAPFIMAREFQNSDNLPEVFAKLDRAERFLPWVEHFKSLKGQLIIGMLQSEPHKVSKDERKLMIDYGLQQLDKAMALNPLNTLVLFYKSELLQLLPDRQREAEQLMRQALRIDPYLLAVRLKLARQLEQRGETAQAALVLSEGLNKAYPIQKPAVMIEYWHAVEKAMGDSQAWEEQKRLARQQIQKLTSLLALPENAHRLLTLPDIGWRP